MGWRDVRAWIESGELEGVDTDAACHRLGGAGVVRDGLLVAGSGGRGARGELAEAIPELVRLSDIKVRIPRLEVVALERVAARERTSVDALLGRELLDFVSAHAEWLSAEVPGFAAALAWPQSS
jgi:hypothetical protein